MFARSVGTLLIASALTFGALGMANAGSDHGKGNGGQNNGKGNGKNSVPELDPTALGRGIIVLAGGLFLLTEGRRRSK
jgi:hypothetical protein